MSINPTRSSSPRNGFTPPSLSILPAHELQLTGFNGSDPSTRPMHARNTEMRVSSLMSSGRAAFLCTFVERVENSCAEYALRLVISRMLGIELGRRAFTYAWKSDNSPTRTSRRESTDMMVYSGLLRGFNNCKVALKSMVRMISRQLATLAGSLPPVPPLLFLDSLVLYSRFFARKYFTHIDILIQVQIHLFHT